MGFAVIQCFEPEDEACLQALWWALADAGIGATMAAGGMRPHITLAAFAGDRGAGQAPSV